MPKYLRKIKCKKCNRFYLAILKTSHYNLLIPESIARKYKNSDIEKNYYGCPHCQPKKENKYEKLINI